MMKSRPVINALQKQKQRDPEELLLDGARLRDFSVQDAQDIADNASGAYLLSLNQCKIHDLKHLPHLPDVEVLEIQDNHLSDSSNLNLIAERTPNVSDLLLSGNNIAKLESLAFIMNLPKLENLELQMNPLTKANPGYRYELFQACEHLKRIDDILRDGSKADSDQEDVDAEVIDAEEEVMADGALSTEDIADRERRRKALADFYDKDLSDDDDDEEDFEEVDDSGDDGNEEMKDYTTSNSIEEE
eukprot:GHVH01010752.1.p1 GENE.GHVH01010752.1~~GHVH01010752.1.p1  ORF type:complete len:245 (+),score=64.85 GHVH01010752.1:71-805(+)